MRPRPSHRTTVSARGRAHAHELAARLRHEGRVGVIVDRGQGGRYSISYWVAHPITGDPL
jgi:hypothetical protein